MANLECHISNIIESSARTAITVRFYILTDNGTDVDGNPIYSRSLVATQTFELGGGLDKASTIGYLLTRVAELNTSRSLNFKTQDFICSL